MGRETRVREEARVRRGNEGSGWVCATLLRIFLFCRNKTLVQSLSGQCLVGGRVPLEGCDAPRCRVIALITCLFTETFILSPPPLPLIAFSSSVFHPFVRL